VSGTRSGFQSLPLSFGEFLTASIIMEVIKERFYYDPQGARHRITPCKGNLNHLVIYHEFATIVEDSGFAMEQAEAIHFQSTIEVFGTYTSST
jgi:hypothetical protein